MIQIKFFIANILDLALKKDHNSNILFDKVYR